MFPSSLPVGCYESTTELNVVVVVVAVLVSHFNESFSEDIVNLKHLQEIKNITII